MPSLCQEFFHHRLILVELWRQLWDGAFDMLDANRERGAPNDRLVAGEQLEFFPSSYSFVVAFLKSVPFQISTLLAIL